MYDKSDETVRISLTLQTTLLAEIEDYWHKEKIANRTQAIQDLIKKGIESERQKNQDSV